MITYRKKTLESLAGYLQISSTKACDQVMNGRMSKCTWLDYILCFPFILRACLLGGGGHQVGEVTRLGGVTRLPI